MKAGGQVLGPRHERGGGCKIREIAIRKWFQTVFEVIQGFSAGLFSGFGEALDAPACCSSGMSIPDLRGQFEVWTVLHFPIHERHRENSLKKCT